MARGLSAELRDLARLLLTLGITALGGSAVAFLVWQLGNAALAAPVPLLVLPGAQAGLVPV